MIAKMVLKYVLAWSSPYPCPLNLQRGQTSERYQDCKHSAYEMPTTVCFQSVLPMAMKKINTPIAKNGKDRSQSLVVLPLIPFGKKMA